MVRPVINVSNRATEFEIKTLKLSYDTQSNIRAPMVWEKPTANLYDYHYEIGGLYYQPMVSYCMSRENGGGRKIVDIPDRIMSNFDKRSYKLSKDECDYEDFLTKCYQRKIRDTHKKTIHCANEGVMRSKKNTELGMLRGSAMMRDKYLNQVQLMYTEKLARGGNMKGMIVEAGEDSRARRSQSVEACEASRDENRMLATKRNDARYGPSYERVTVLDSERYNKGQDVDFINARSIRAKSVEASAAEASSSMEQSSSSKTVRVVKMSSGTGENIEEFFTDNKEASESNRKSFVNKDFLAADNMREFLDARNTERLKKEAMSVKSAAPLYPDTTYSKAKYDVNRRIKMEGDKLLPSKSQISDIKYNFRGRTIGEIGSFEKSVIRAEMYKRPAIPDFDVGYDIV